MSQKNKIFKSSKRPYDSNLAESFVSRFYNSDTYAYEYNNFTYEIAAEKYAVKEVYDYFHKNIGNFPIDNAMLDYINAKANIENNPSDTYPYFIRSHSLYKNMDDVFEDFDKAYKQSLDIKKDFTSYVDQDNLISDILDKDKDLKAGFDLAKDGKEQTHFVTNICLNKYPERYKEFKNIDRKNYDLNEVYDKVNELYNEKMKLLERYSGMSYDNDQNDFKL
jgi:hypothetical protein